MKKQYHYLCSSSMIPLVVVLLFLLTIDAGSSSRNGGSSSGSSSRKTARKKVTKKNTATTLKAVMARYPELQDLSSEQRNFQYKYYLQHMNGATSEELDQYKPVSFGWFSCCKDGDHSTGCEWIEEDDDMFCKSTPNPPHSINLAECESAGYGTNKACCRSSLIDSRVGSKDWFWEKCT